MERGIITISENSAVTIPTVPVWMTQQEVVRVHAAETSRNQYGCVRFYHSFAYGMDVHDVRGAIDAFRTPARDGGYFARLYPV